MWLIFQREQTLSSCLLSLGLAFFVMLMRKIISVPSTCPPLSLSLSSTHTHVQRHRVVKPSPTQNSSSQLFCWEQRPICTYTFTYCIWTHHMCMLVPLMINLSLSSLSHIPVFMISVPMCSVFGTWLLIAELVVWTIFITGQINTFVLCVVFVYSATQCYSIAHYCSMIQ